MILGDVAHDAETESRATGFARATGIDPVKTLEDALQVLCWYAHAVVTNLDVHAGWRTITVGRGGGVVATDRDLDGASARRVDDRILEQRVQRRRQLSTVTEDHLVGLGFVEVDLDVVLFGGGANPLDR